MPNDFFQFDTGQATDTGCRRDHNEDSHISLPDAGLWVVADGMGGHDAGDFASQAITDEMRSLGLPGSADDLQARFMARLTRAHERIAEHAASAGGVTVGATVVGLLVYDQSFYCVWSGDSRIYLLRDGVLVQQTTDHTEVRQLLDSGAISPEEAKTWPRKNVITRAIGVAEAPECEVVAGRLQPNDVFLLCSDGLTEHLSDEDLAAMMTANSAQLACDRMIAETLARGARDNVTAVIVRCLEAEMAEPEGV